MKKLAIFVEGQTEEVFIEKLLLEFANQNSIVFNINRLSGGKSCDRTPTIIKSEATTKHTEYYILIFTSCSDERVVSDYKERYHKLIDAGYDKILALRDLYPQSYENLERISGSITTVLNMDGIPNNIHIATREVETWFLGEYTHFSKIHEDITFSAISQHTSLSFPLEEYEQTILEPAKTLDKIYSSVGFRYKKRENQVLRTVNNIDYEYLYLEVRHKIPSLDYFIKDIDLFFEI